MERFIKLYQKDIVSNPERWIDSEPGKYIELPDRAKRLYCVLSVMSFSAAGNASDVVLNDDEPLGDGWFWVTPSLLQKLTGLSIINVHRAANDLVEDGFIGYHADSEMSDRSYFLITGEDRFDSIHSQGIQTMGTSSPDAVPEVEGTQEEAFTKPPKSWPNDIWDFDPMAEIIKEEIGEDAYIVYCMDTSMMSPFDMTTAHRERFESFTELELATIRKDMYSRTDIPEIFKKK